MPRDYAARMAREKALAAADDAAHVLAGDTVVAVGRRILPKAEDEATARACLELLSGRRHRVLSADRAARPRRHAARAAAARRKCASSRSPRRRSPPISPAASGTARPAATPSRAAPRALIAWISGSHSGVVGLPLFEARALLKSRGLPRWLRWSCIEEGIGEHRAILLGSERIAGRARRLARRAGSGPGRRRDPRGRAPRAAARGTARFASGEEALVDGLRRPRPAKARRSGSRSSRPALGERGRRKLARARPTEPLRAPRRRWSSDCEPKGTWCTVVPEVPRQGRAPSWPRPSPAKSPSRRQRSTFSPTPAMLLVDVDGTLAPRALALAAGRRRSPRRCAGSTSAARSASTSPPCADKADRRAVDEALAAALAGWPHERTAMNGFGFVQLVARLERPSLLHRAAFQRAGLAAHARCCAAPSCCRRRGACCFGPSGARSPAQARSGSRNSPAARGAKCAGKHARPCHRGPAGPTRAAMTTRPCPICKKPRSEQSRPVLLEPLPRPRPRPLVQRGLRGPRPAGRSREHPPRKIAVIPAKPPRPRASVEPAARGPGFRQMTGDPLPSAPLRHRRVLQRPDRRTTRGSGACPGSSVGRACD